MIWVMYPSSQVFWRFLCRGKGSRTLLSTWRMNLLDSTIFRHDSLTTWISQRLVSDTCVVVWFIPKIHSIQIFLSHFRYYFLNRLGRYSSSVQNSNIYIIYIDISPLNITSSWNSSVICLGCGPHLYQGSKGQPSFYDILLQYCIIHYWNSMVLNWYK